LDSPFYYAETSLQKPIESLLHLYNKLYAINIQHLEHKLLSLIFIMD